MNVLLIEDDSRVVQFLDRALRAEGHCVQVARSGREGVQRTREGSPDIVILDLMLPGLDGREVCQQIRSSGSRVPILILSALDSTSDIVQGLHMGADDYMTKPFALDELLARLEALRRRSQWPGERGRETRLAVGDLVFDRDRVEVRRAGRQIDLSAREIALLELLMTSAGKVVSRARILNNVWGHSEDPLTNIVDVYVRRLRTKLERGGEPHLITTVRGFGYRLDGTSAGQAFEA